MGHRQDFTIFVIYANDLVVALRRVRDDWSQCTSSPGPGESDCDVPDVGNLAELDFLKADVLNLLIREEIDDVRLGGLRGFFDVHLLVPSNVPATRHLSLNANTRLESWTLVSGRREGFAAGLAADARASEKRRLGRVSDPEQPRHPLLLPADTAADTQDLHRTGCRAAGPAILCHPPVTCGDTPRRAGRRELVPDAGGVAGARASAGLTGTYHYVPVGARRARVARVSDELRRNSVDVQPVHIEGRTIAHSFWGRRWCHHLESCSDFENRLPRGRAYVRNGSVCHLDVRAGGVDAMVVGSDLYHVVVGIRKLGQVAWMVAAT